MSLADYDGGGGEYMQAGNHCPVTVDSHKMVENPGTGNKGVEFSFVDKQGLRAKGLTFWLTEKAMWRLAAFARDCGLTEQERRAYDETNPASHRKLHRRQVGIVVVKDGKYHNVEDWYAIDSEAPKPAVKPAPPQTEVEPVLDGAMTASDIPF